MKVGVILGTRPEIIKLSPVIDELKRRRVDFELIHTGQHYSYTLDRIFMEQLKLPEPDYRLDVGSGSHAEQTAKMLLGIEQIVRKEKFDLVIVQGDTNSTLSGALASVKVGVPVAHVEAGLRSFDNRMPEEINRKIVSAVATYHFAPTKVEKMNLMRSGVSRDRIFVVGNTVVDACLRNIVYAKKPDIPLEREFVLLTAHRPETVDRKKTLESVISEVKKIGLQVVFPIHPRTANNLKKFKIDTSGIDIVKPLGYLEFLYLLSKASIIITDSGGVSEEAVSLGKPCLIIREATDRPALLESPNIDLVGYSELIYKKAKKLMNKKQEKFKYILGKGDASRKIVNILKTLYEKGLMGIEYLDMVGLGYPKYVLKKKKDRKSLVFEKLTDFACEKGIKVEELYTALYPVNKKIYRGAT